MGRKTRSHGLHKGSNFPLIGAAFLVLIAAAVFVFGNFWESRLDDEAFGVLTHTRYEVIDDQNAYDFLMAIKPEFAESETVPHLQINTSKFHSEVSSFFRSVDEQLLPSSQRNELARGIMNQTWIWDAERLGGYHCLSPREISNIREKWDEVLSRDDYDFPSEFSLSFHQFSRPVFTKDGRYAVIQHYYYCGPLCAEEEIVLYVNNNGKWERVKQHVLWVS